VSWAEGESSEDGDGDEESMTGIFDKLQLCLAFTLSEGKGAEERDGESSVDIFMLVLYLL